MSHLIILLRTTQNRGDHDAETVIAYDSPDGETVRDLAERLLRETRPFAVDGYRHTDWIEIRIAKETP